MHHENHHYPVALPRWLTASNRHDTPFTRDTQMTLAKNAQHDARIAKVVTDLEAAIPPGSKEWGFVENFCRDASKQLLNSHEHFVKANHCDIERNLMRLGAYMGDYSYAGLMQHIHLRVTPSHQGPKQEPLTEAEKRTLCEAVRVVLPILLDQQPKIAIAFAEAIYRTQVWYELQPETLVQYERLAMTQPRMVLTMFDRFKTFPNRQKLYDLAQDARAKDPLTPPSIHQPQETRTAAQMEEAQLQMLEKFRPNFFDGVKLRASVQSR